MLLSIATSHQPATDLGYLLHKHPDRVQTFPLNFGNATVFYPSADEQNCEVCLLLDIDPVGIVRGRKRQSSFLLNQYVNDRPYVASSLMSVAISKVFRTAMSGRCPGHQELADSAIPLSITIDVLPVRGGSEFLNQVFEPLGYAVESVRQPLDDQFPDWGDSPYHCVTLTTTKKLSEVLTHLYVLIPVFDNQKHYFVSDDELEKLLSKGEGWLAQHPEKDQIARRYLKHRFSLYNEAVARLADSTNETADEIEAPAQVEEVLEQSISLNDQRHEAVLSEVLKSGAKRVVDLGCGEGKLLRRLMNERQFEQITGVDVSFRSLEIATKRLKLERMPDRQRERLQLVHGSLMYRDQRFSGFDTAAIVEVIEHLDPPRLAAMERVVFECARPLTVVLTTPNREYNTMWETLPAGEFRHSDHRFEWTRKEFQAWSNRVAAVHGYHVDFKPVGPEDPSVGAPTQMAVFVLGGGGADDAE